MDFPEIALFHGRLDKTIPTALCTELHNIMQIASSKTSLTLYEDWGHTDAILEDLLMGETLLVDDIAATIQACEGMWGAEVSSSNARSAASNVVVGTGEEGAGGRRRRARPRGVGDAPVMVNAHLVRIAKVLNPF
jgi:hypothetical protein